MSKALNEKPYAEPLPVAASAGVMLNGRYLPPPEKIDSPGRHCYRVLTRECGERIPKGTTAQIL
jgi:hypothetical protein